MNGKKGNNLRIWNKDEIQVIIIVANGNPRPRRSFPSFAKLKEKTNEVNQEEQRKHLEILLPFIK